MAHQSGAPLGGYVMSLCGYGGLFRGMWHIGRNVCFACSGNYCTSCGLDALLLKDLSGLRRVAME